MAAATNGAHEQRPPISTAHRVRGIYATEDEAAEFLKQGIPTFETSEACTAWVKAHCRSESPPSNPERPHMTQLLTTLANRGQVETYLLGARAEYDQRFPPQLWSADASAEALEANRWLADEDARKADGELKQRLDLPPFASLTPAAAEATLWYLFEHMRSGIYVMIRRNRVRMFVPFVNEDFRNAWGPRLKLEGNQSVKEYYARKRDAGMRKEHVLPDKAEWWANGNILCNEHSSTGAPKGQSQLWGDRFVASLRAMLDAVCAERTVGDCEFFVNKRDYPQVKFHGDATGGELVEPYGFLVDGDDRDPAQDVTLPRKHRGRALAPVFSFYCSSRFADCPLPTSEDWEAAEGLILPPSFDHTVADGDVKLDASPRDLFTEAKFRQFDCDWSEKRETAFFRGTATGGGVDTATNQRLALADLGARWASPDPQPRDRDKAAEATPLLDAKLTGWNRRDKKVAGRPVTFVQPDRFPFDAGRRNFVPIFEQSRYKYLVYVEGHCAACRYGFMMRLGSVILKVESRCVADTMWFFPLLRPFVDHVPVRADLSDLADRVRWCRANDGACRAIAANARALYDRYLARDGLLDYVQLALCRVAERYRYPAAWLAPPADGGPPPKLGSTRTACVGGKLCDRCRDDGTRAEEARAEAAGPPKRGRSANRSTFAHANQKPQGLVRPGSAGGDAALRARMKRKKTG